jgi:hypothetical protein
LGIYYLWASRDNVDGRKNRVSSERWNRYFIHHGRCEALMIIHTVEWNESGEGYIVNRGTDGQYGVPAHDSTGNRHTLQVLEWIDGGGIVSDWVNPMTPTQIWYDEIALLDKDMPRSLEDMLDGMPDKSGVNQITLDRLQAKKDKRGERP